MVFSTVGMIAAVRMISTVRVLFSAVRMMFAAVLMDATRLQLALMKVFHFVHRGLQCHLMLPEMVQMIGYGSP